MIHDILPTLLLKQIRACLEVAKMQLRLEMSLFLVVLVAIGNTARGGPASEISWSSAVMQTEAILRKDCGDKCVEVARQDVAVCNCKFL